MTNKSTSFKRIALALVASLGFGVLSSGSSVAVLSTATTTTTLSASSASAAPGETVSVTATVNFTSTLKDESLTVVLSDGDGGDGASGVTERLKGLTTDSVNVRTAAGSTGTAIERTNGFSVFSSTNSESVVAGTTRSSGKGMFIYSNASGAEPVTVQAKVTIEFLVGTTAPAGTYNYNVILRSDLNGTFVNYDVDAFVLTVTAKDLTAAAAKSQLFVNAALCATALCDGLAGGNGSSSDARGIESDSTLVVSAGTPATGGTISYSAVGYMFGVIKNAADTVTVLGEDVAGTITVSLSGPGALSKRSDATKVKSLTITQSSDTITIWSDGTAGTATITGYIGTTALTQAAKTVTFHGKVASVTLSETSVASRNGGQALSSDAADSVTIGNNLVTFTMKDSAGNTVRTAAMNRNADLYCISSDTSVVGMGVGTSPASFEAAAINTTTGVGACNLVVRKAGTATISVADESIVANSTFSASKTLTFAKEVNSTTKGIGTIAFDKTTYNIGEKATITVTVLNADKAVPGLLLVNGDEYTTASVFPTLVQNREFSSVGTTSTGSPLGFGTDRAGKTFSLTGSTFVAGVETYVVYMPTVQGDFTLTGFTTDGTYDTATAVNVKVSVVDPNAALIASAQAAADAATDAANEAIDAANAATDAANLAAEAADAATVAAEEARDAADAATAAV